MALLSPNGSVPPGKKSVVLTVYNVFCCLSGSTGIFFPKILPVKEDRRTPFQNTVIDTGVSQIRRVFQLGQFQVCCDNHGPAAAVAAVDDEKHMLHSIFGPALYSPIVNDKPVSYTHLTDVLYMTGNDHALEAADPLELAEIKRRWEPYSNQLPDYPYLCKDLLNGKM